MKIKKFYLIFMCLFITGSYPVEPTITQIAGTPSYPSLSAWWQIPPQIVVCERSEVRRGNLGSAIRYWTRLGYSFEDPIFTSDHNPSCVNGPQFGEITIDMPNQDFNFSNLGQTKTYIEPDLRIIIKAKIEIQSNGLTRERVLEHEIGHAFGWRDNSKTGHIMNGTWSLSGLNSQGLRKLEIPE